MNRFLELALRRHFNCLDVCVIFASLSMPFFLGLAFLIAGVFLSSFLENRL